MSEGQKLRSLFVVPNDTEIRILGGEYWIRVRDRLSYGEEQRLATSSFGKASTNRDTGQVEFAIDMEKQQTNRILYYVSEWNFVDHTGKRAPLNEAFIRNLDPDVADEIQAAITAHLDEVELRKKEQAQATGTEDSATSL